MSFNLIDAIKAKLTPSVVQSAGDFIGANPASTQKALDAAVPSMVGGIAKQGSTDEGASKLMSSLNGTTGAEFSDLTREGGQADLAERGKGMVGSLFGDKQDKVTEAIGNHAGIGGGAASKLMGLLAPLGLGVLGRHAREQNLDKGGLKALMEEHLPLAGKAMPSSVGKILGIGGGKTAEPTPIREKKEEPARVHAERERAEPRAVQKHRPTPKKSGASWAIPIALACIALLAIWGLFRGHKQSEQRAARTAAPTMEQRQARAPAEQRPGQAPPRAGEQGALGPAITGNSPLPQRVAMENLTFATGSTQLDPQAQQSVTEAANALKANPNARIRIEGYADPSGNPATNQQLSQQRAEAVKDAMVRDGASANQIEVRGFGEQQGGQMARRTDFVILSR